MRASMSGSDTMLGGARPFGLGYWPLAEDDPGVAEPIFISEIKTHALPNGEYRVSFAVKNVTDQLLIIRAIPFDAKAKALMGGKRFKIQPRSDVQHLGVVVPLVEPRELRLFCGEFQTNRFLRW